MKIYRGGESFFLSENITKNLGHKVIGTEHLLLAPLEGEGIAAKALKELGLISKNKNKVIQITGKSRH